MPSMPGRTQSSSARSGASGDSSNLTASVPLPTATYSKPQSLRQQPSLCLSIYESSTRRTLITESRSEHRKEQQTNQKHHNKTYTENAEKRIGNTKIKKTQLSIFFFSSF